MAAAALTLWLVLFFRTGKEHRPAFRAKYLREVPEGVPPALAGAVWHMGVVTDDDLSATLLDLAVAGILEDLPGLGGRVRPLHSTEADWARPMTSPSPWCGSSTKPSAVTP